MTSMRTQRQASRDQQCNHIFTIDHVVITTLAAGPLLGMQLGWRGTPVEPW